jgi:hypothetical protein
MKDRKVKQCLSGDWYQLKEEGYKKKVESSSSRLARLRRPKIICSPSYADFRSRAKAVMLLVLGHMLRGEHIQENGDR